MDETKCQEYERIIKALGEFLEFNTMPDAGTLMPDSETETFAQAIRKAVKQPSPKK